MRNISDDELDKLFREAAQHGQPEFDPQDWEKLSKRLDRDDRISWYKRIAVYIPLILLLLTASWWGVYQYKTSSTASIAKTAEGTRSIASDDDNLENLLGNDDASAAGRAVTEDSSDATINHPSIVQRAATDAAAENTLPADSDKETALSSKSSVENKHSGESATSVNRDVQKEQYKEIKSTERGGKGNAAINNGATVASGDKALQSNSATYVDGKPARARKNTGGVKVEKVSGHGDSLSSHDADTIGFVSKDKKDRRVEEASMLSTDKQKKLPASRQNIAVDKIQTIATSNTSSPSEEKRVQTNDIATKQDIAALGLKDDAVNAAEHKPDLIGQPAALDRNANTENKATEETTNTAAENRQATAFNDSNKTGNDWRIDSMKLEQRDENAATAAINRISSDNRNSKPAAVLPQDNGNAINQNNSVIPTDGKADRQNQSISPAIYTDIGIQSKNRSDSAAVKNNSNANAVDKKDGAAASLQEASMNKTDSAQVKDDTLTVNKDRADSTASVTKEEHKEKAKRKGIWFTKLVLSPDFSAIGYTKPGKPGINVGLLGEYSPSKHWGFSIGAIWSKKLYGISDPGITYTNQGNTWYAEYLDGDCRVLDIPINITYYLVPASRLNVFVTVGTSSYVMLKESYVYTMSNNNDAYLYSENYKNKNRNWFSMLNLSIGLQYKINERFYFQVEPFLKAPISGVGQGKVNLVSAGSFFTLKYQLNK
ncbi:porin family protein [Ohtaekwangia sp.]|uniref:porin family protein n=1 Tax=Ohtaekwangia sp. TaxID=2066019 RepID=UPI002FDD9C5B